MAEGVAEGRNWSENPDILVNKNTDRPEDEGGGRLLFDRSRGGEQSVPTSCVAGGRRRGALRSGDAWRRPPHRRGAELWWVARPPPPLPETAGRWTGERELKKGHEMNEASIDDINGGPGRERSEVPEGLPRPGAVETP